MVPPSPELFRKYKNTDDVIKAGKEYMLPNLIANFPNDYVDLPTYESIKKAIQLP